MSKEKKLTRELTNLISSVPDGTILRAGGGVDAAGGGIVWVMGILLDRS